MESQFIPQAFVNILVSVICWVLFSMSILSFYGILTGGGFLVPDLPLTTSAFYGLFLGLLHGCITSGIIYVFKIDSLIGMLVSSFVATEILIFVGIIVGIAFYILNQPTGRPVESAGILVTVFGSVALFCGWFAFLSVLFIIPTILIGISTGLLRSR